MRFHPIEESPLERRDLAPRTRELPIGTVTFLFTDIEGSTTLARTLGERWIDVLGDHHRLLRAAIEGAGGVVVRTEGDSFFAAFSMPADAVRAAASGQRAIAAHPWPDDAPIHVRMGLHTGTGIVVDDDYVGYDVHRAARVGAAGHGGQVLLSETTRALIGDGLPDDLAVRDLGRHRLKDVGPQPLHQLVVPGLRADFPPVKAIESPSTLPVHLTQFVGRERELARVDGLLRSSRLLTLTGPGGTGKTRLAIEAARRAGGRFDAVHFVDLAPVSDPGFVVAAIAETVGAKEDDGRSLLEDLRARLAERDTLLLLDNFEQILDAAGAVADLLATCARLVVIVTSRAPLRIGGEQECPVPPLALADPDRLPPLDELARFEAVALFVLRASAVDPDFSLTEDVARPVAEICARLDGLPLAIELAASHLRSLSPDAILERLDRRLPVLTGGARDHPERQRTLRSTIAWSEELLDATHRTMFARLSVLLGDWTLEGAEAVANPGMELGVDTLDALEALVDHSLLRRGPAGEGGPWFSMLETIREYGRERLTESGEEEAIRRRHAAHFLEVAEAGELGMTGARAAAWRERVDRENPNLRAAVEWSLESGDAETGLRITAALWRVWLIRGTLREGKAVMDELLALPDAEPRTAVRAKALLAAGSVAYWARDPGRARRSYEEALSISEELDDPSGIAHGLYNVSFVDGMEGATDLAIRRAEDARRRFERLGDRRMAAYATLGLAVAERMRGDAERAERFANEALAEFEAIEELLPMGMTNGVLASIAAQRGDEPTIIEHTVRALEASASLRDHVAMAVQVGIAASLLGNRGHHERALRLAGAASAIRERTGGEAPSALVGMTDPREAARSSLGDDQIAALLDDGASMSPEELYALTLRELDELRSS